MPEKFQYRSGNLVPADERLCVFHYLVPAVPSIVEDATAWHGRINAVVQRTRTELRQTEEKAAKERETLRKDLKKDVKRVCDDMEEFKAEVRDSISTLREDYNNGFEALVSHFQSLEGKLDALPNQLSQTQPNSS